MNSPLRLFNAQQTAQLLDFPSLVDALAAATADYAAGLINAPERQVVPFAVGGAMLSMPATAADIGIHKLVNVVPQNRACGVPTINGVVSVFDGATGQTLCVLDGPTVTARRTAAVSMLGIKIFLKNAPLRVALVGTGTQSDGHAQALAALFPGVQVIIVGSSLQKAQDFASQHAALPLEFEAATQVPSDVDVVITLTTSQTPVYSLPAKAGRLVVGVGAFKADCAEIHASTLLASQIYVDDLAGARHEAGDIILANADWNQVKPLADALAHGVDFDRPIVFKTVGCAAWDLAAARCALAALEKQEPKAQF